MQISYCLSLLVLFAISLWLIHKRSIISSYKVRILVGLVFQLLMTGIAVLKVDNLGRRPLLIGGVGGIVRTYFCFVTTSKFP